MDGHIVIKVILIAAFIAIAAFLIVPGRGVRHAAVRRLLLAFVFVVAVAAVVFPNAMNRVANAMGVGRGADLLLYGFIIVFIGNALVQQRHNRHMEQEITLLARRIAITEAKDPTAAGYAGPPDAGR